MAACIPFPARFTSGTKTCTGKNARRRIATSNSKKDFKLKTWICLSVLALSGAAHAYDGASSELSHTAFSAALAGAVTHAYCGSENRAWIGFAVATGASALHQGYQATHGASKSGSLLDFASSAIGAALGAWVTNRYILTPILKPKMTGLVFSRSF